MRFTPGSLNNRPAPTERVEATPQELMARFGQMCAITEPVRAVAGTRTSMCSDPRRVALASSGDGHGTMACIRDGTR